MSLKKIALAMTGLMLAVAAPASARTGQEESKAAETRPNFLVIVADDLGWSDLGAFGGEIDTPNLDGLALSGVRFTGFHTAPTCSPTRSMLMSGVDNHQAGLGTMAEALPRTPGAQGRPGYEGYLNDRVASIAELLREGGYRTVMAGKWHLGLTEERGPAARGFERSYALLQGLSNFFGADQTDAWKQAGFVPLFREDGRLVKFPVGQYTTDYFTDRLITYLREGQAKGDRRPFFAYLPYTAPHWPLQAPDADIAKYKGRYDAGYEALREARLSRQKALGLIPRDVVAHPFVGVTPWGALDEAQRAAEARKMEVYAAMVDRLDRNVGRVIAELKRLGVYENTAIIFLSDNGTEGNQIENPRIAGTDEKAVAALGIDNSLGNLGRANSYVGYGPGWAQASSTPSQLMKSYPTEGGIRTVAFAAGRGVAGSGRISRGLLDVRDVAPTLLDYASVRQKTTYGGRAILPIQGHSLRPVLENKATEVRGAEEPVGRELFFRRAIRLGDWKAVLLPVADVGYTRSGAGDGIWHLYNVASDPGETKDLSATEPARLKRLIAAYDDYARENGVVSQPAVSPAK